MTARAGHNGAPSCDAGATLAAEIERLRGAAVSAARRAMEPLERRYRHQWQPSRLERNPKARRAMATLYAAAEAAELAKRQPQIDRLARKLARLAMYHAHARNA